MSSITTCNISILIIILLCVRWSARTLLAYSTHGLKATLALTPDNGSLMAEYQKMIFSSNVLMTNSSGNTLQTDYLRKVPFFG